MGNELKISLAGWIEDVKGKLDDAEYAVKGYCSDNEEEIVTSAVNRARGFMQDMNNIFAGLGRCINDEEMLKWAKNIQELLCTRELKEKYTEDCFLKKGNEEKDSLEKEMNEFGDTSIQSKINTIEWAIERRKKLLDILTYVGEKGKIQLGFINIDDDQILCNLRDLLKIFCKDQIEKQEQIIRATKI